MKIYAWLDRRVAATPRAVMQRGECARGQCGQFSISISNGQTGLTIRFESQAEFAHFMEHGEVDCEPDASASVVIEAKGT